MRSTAITRALAGALVTSMITGCGAASIRRFPLADALWVDDDMRVFRPRPPEWYSPYVWDGVDNSVMRPLADVFLLELDREAIDVNALDEVPDSSWYVSRLGRDRLSPEVVARGACEDEDQALAGIDDDIPPPLTITRGKPDGSSPGFFVRDARGQTYLLKPDGDLQRERPSAADAIAAAVFWAAGYHVPCNRVVFLRRDQLILDPRAEERRTDGRRGPLTREIVDEILELATETEDGRLRFGLSRFIEGDPIAPWTYEGTWDADPNDVIAHEHRREVRAMYVLSSWLGHIDSRQENTMAAWMENDDGRGYVRHYMIDFSDCFGILFSIDALARRFGHSGYFDVQHMVEDFLTLGLVERPWNEVRFGLAGRELGYFDLEHYAPDQWRPGYPNPAYERMTENDAAWMTRIVARFSDEHVRALVARGRFSDPIVADELTRIMIGRRDRLLERWLTRLSPLTDPRVDESGARICVEDRAITSGIRDPATRRYEARAYRSDALTPRAIEQIDTRADGRICVEIPRARGATPTEPRYLVIDIVASSIDRERTRPLRVHAYDLGAEVRVVGVERPGDEEPPRP